MSSNWLCNNLVAWRKGPQWHLFAGENDSLLLTINTLVCHSPSAATNSGPCYAQSNFMHGSDFLIFLRWFPVDRRARSLFFFIIVVFYYHATSCTGLSPSTNGHHQILLTALVRVRLLGGHHQILLLAAVIWVCLLDSTTSYWSSVSIGGFHRFTTYLLQSTAYNHIS